MTVNWYIDVPVLKGRNWYSLKMDLRPFITWTLILCCSISLTSVHMLDMASTTDKQCALYKSVKIK